MTADSSRLQDFIAEHSRLVNQFMEQSLANIPAAGSLVDTMRYALLSGGKRIRPLLLMATIEATGGNPRVGLAAAAALEMVHCYSLIHDDLPAMDNDSLRRGQPTSHIVYGEANAILAGDGLQALAFDLIAREASYSPEQRLHLIKLLAKASGAEGMVAGQAIDLSVVGQALDSDSLEHMHLLKTGALLEASVLMGAICNQLSDEKLLAALRAYAQAVGLAFQVRDDIMDVQSDTLTLGKTQGKDAAHNKPTFISLMGLEGARKKAAQLHSKAINALNSGSLSHTILSDLSAYIVARNS